jgi:hypothetical protein
MINRRTHHTSNGQIVTGLLATGEYGAKAEGSCGYGHSRSAAIADLEHKMAEARMRLAIVRSDALFNFYSAERRAGACPLVANERMAEFAKRLDAPSPYEVEQEAVRKIIGEVA